MLGYDFTPGTDWSLPFSLSYTWMDATFDSDIASTEFFGDVSAGDPVPYIPRQQLLVQLGFEHDQWATYLSANYLDKVCTVASCGEFQQTDSSLTFDLASHFAVNDNIELYGLIENLTQENAILGRHPYGARPNKDRSATLGFKIQF
jgi:Fe(3+) dicitrate transport protein